MAWRHINLFSTFEFNDSTAAVNIDALAAHYADLAYWHKLGKEFKSVQGTSLK